MKRRKFLKAAAVGGVAASLGGVGLLQAAPRQLKISRHEVALGGRTLRVVQLTDLHIGRATPALLLRQALRVAHAARPDLLVLTGDYLNRTLRYLHRLDRFAALLPRVPSLAILGNHDHWSGAEAIAETLRRRSILVLRNSHVSLRLGGRQLTVVGVDDETTGHADVRRAFHRVARPDRALVLAHNPRTADAIVAHGGRLVLAGHTHGGQISIPRLTRALARAGGLRYLSGWYDIGPGRLYVSPGVGSAVIRMRLGSRAAPEIALFELGTGAV